MRKNNMHPFDRGARTVISIGIIIWITTSTPIFGSFIITLLLAFFGFLNLYAALTGICLGYSFFGLSTREKD